MKILQSGSLLSKAGFCLFFIGFFATTSCASDDEVNLYSARKEALIKPLLDLFTQETGIKVNLVTAGGDALLNRLQNEGKNSPADLLITTDVGRLYRAQQAGVLQQIDSQKLNTNIAASYREKNGYWFGLSLRSRVIVYAKDRVKSDALTSYEDLADKKWQKKICIRSSGNIYNQSLVASLIVHHGEEKTENLLKGIVANFARSPQGGDRDQIKAVAAGQCDLAVVNTYYLGAMMLSSDQNEKKAAQAVGLLWPNQQDRGAHFNISGAGVTKASPNKANAIKLLEFLSSEKAQQWYAKVNNEYPVNPQAGTSDLLKLLGEFKPDTVAVEKLGELNAKALMLMDKAGWK